MTCHEFESGVGDCVEWHSFSVIAPFRLGIQARLHHLLQEACELSACSSSLFR